jgi:hypothetical protein
MEFKTEAHRACYEKIGQWLRELQGEDNVRPRTDSTMFGIGRGSAYITVLVWPNGEQDAWVSTRSWVVTKVELTPDLMKYLLRKNYDMTLGAFGIDDAGDIFFEHTILGSSCDKEELRASVGMVSFIADKYDDEIVGRWGGERSVDRS